MLQTQMPIDPEDRPRYTRDQVNLYFRGIEMPEKHLHSPILANPSLALTITHGLPLLHALCLHHISHIPFENLELHYSKTKNVSLQTDDLFTRLAQDRHRYGRGGRCMENNTFFSTVLRSLGYDVRNCAARVSRMMHPSPEVRQKQGKTYNGWTHMLNLVRLDGSWFVVDVGMGAMGPNLVYPLRDGYEAESVAPRRIRLQKRSIAEHAAATEEDAPKLWCFDVCPRPSLDKCHAWTPVYCFTETEYLPQDYEVMSWFTSASPKSFFTTVVLCQKMFLDEAGESIIGDLCLRNGTVTMTMQGHREIIRQCYTEQERVSALEEFFGIHLTHEQQKAISQPTKLK